MLINTLLIKFLIILTIIFIITIIVLGYPINSYKDISFKVALILKLSTIKYYNISLLSTLSLIVFYPF